MESIIYSLLYIFSGTGNSYRVACWIKEYIENKGFKTLLKFIDEADFKKDFQAAGKQYLYLLFPVHGFMPPWSVIKFLFRIPRKKNLPAVIIVTRGALYIGPVKIPGAAGFSVFFAAIVLFVKGYNLRGIRTLDMAANMSNFHPVVKPDNVKKIAAKSRAQTEDFTGRVISGKRVFFTLNTLYEGIWTIMLFWLLPVFPIAYLIYGKTFMAKIMFSNNRCTGCGMCAKICPNHAIEMKDFSGKKRPFWTYHCENCMRCMAYCKRKAVEAGHSWGVLLLFLLTVPLMYESILWLLHFAGISFDIQQYWARLLICSLFFLPSIYLSYRIFWILNRFRIINNLFTLTTLTHYYKRYHEPETGLKDLVGKKKDKESQ